MNVRSWILTVTILSTPIGLLTTSGCGPKNDSPAPPQAKTAGAQAPAAQPAKVPLLQKKEILDWCREHGVAESVCTRCNESLIPEFKKKGDWCNNHNLPDSQCIACHPELEAKLKAMAPKTEGS